jgi:hypothetical protein
MTVMATLKKMKNKSCLAGVVLATTFFLFGCVSSRLPETAPEDLLPVDASIPTVPLETPESFLTHTPVNILPTEELKVTTTPTLTIDPEPDEIPLSVAPGKIYGYFGNFYGNLYPTKTIQRENPLLGGDTSRSQFWNELLFAPYTNRLTFTQEIDGAANVWISDLELEEAHLIWTDNQNWLSYDWFGGYLTDQTWGSSDQSLIISDTENWVLISISEKRAVLLSANCDHIGISPKTNNWALSCSSDQGYLVVEQSGALWTTLSLPFDQPMEAVLWDFSPDQSQVLFVNPAGEIMVAQNEGILNLGLTSIKIHRDLYVDTLQWSLDSEKVLVLAENESGCPINDVDDYCWLLIEIATKQILWPVKNFEFHSMNSVVLSPDANWLAYDYRDPPFRGINILSIYENEVFQIGRAVSTKGLRWAE